MTVDQWVYARQMDFPAVTVCNTNLIKKSALSESPELSSLLESWEQQDSNKRRKREVHGGQKQMGAMDQTKSKNVGLKVVDKSQVFVSEKPLKKGVKESSYTEETFPYHIPNRRVKRSGK